MAVAERETSRVPAYQKERKVVGRPRLFVWMPSLEREGAGGRLKPLLKEQEGVRG